jgi:hypothetical protein
MSYPDNEAIMYLYSHPCGSYCELLDHPFMLLAQHFTADHTFVSSDEYDTVPEAQAELKASGFVFVRSSEME